MRELTHDIRISERREKLVGEFATTVTRCSVPLADHRAFSSTTTSWHQGRAIRHNIPSAPDAQPRSSRSLSVNRAISSWLAAYGSLFDHLFASWFSFGTLLSQIKARPSGIGCPSLWDQNSARLAWCGSLQHSRSEPSGTSPWKVAQPSASATWICMCTVVAPFPLAHNVITPVRAR
jgi:hypothetical protein